MECKIGARAAKWLARALKQGADPAMPFSVVSVQKIDGKTYVGATDMFRLHVLEVTDALPVGPYTLDPQTGMLTPVVMAYGVAVQWAAVVPHPSDLYRIDLLVDDADHVNVGGNICYQFLVDGTANVKCEFVDQAINGSYGYRVLGNCNPYGPIKIELLQEQVNRYAILIPIRAAKVVGAVRV